MSWFKKQGLRPDGRSDGRPVGVAAPTTIHPPPAAPSAVKTAASVAKMVARPRSGTDPDTCLEVFRSHWLQAVTIMNKANSATPGARRQSQQEDVDTVMQHVDQMMLLLVEEQGDANGQGPILQFMLSEDVLEKILTWSGRTGEHVDRLRLQHIKTFDMLISQAQQPLLVHKPIIRPLLKLLTACAEQPNRVLEKHLILLLHQLCVCVTQDTQLLELLFDASPEQGPAKFLMFSLLIPYVHREGAIGQQARDALLLIMALSARHDNIGTYIAENSDFCPVLATGLSGLYSSLARKLNVPADDWYRLTDEDISSMPDLVMFLNSLEFCNAVVQVAHPLVRDQLLTFIYNGFLVPVIGPALHQNEIALQEPNSAETEGEEQEQEAGVKPDSVDGVDSDDEYGGGDDDSDGAQSVDMSDILKLPISLVESYFGNSMEEVIAATAYLELFIRRITEPALIRTFLRFVLTARHDDIYILDSLITRISSNSRLCMVSLSLFLTLVDLNCEDVMFQLILKYLIPCTHVMVSQRRSVKDLELYSRTAEKFLSLTPACCVPDLSDTPPDGGTTPVVPDSASSGSSSRGVNNSLPPGNIDKRKTKARMSFRGFRKNPAVGNHNERRSSSPDTTATGALPPGALGGKLEHYETSYMEYLEDVHEKIYQCARSCLCWSSPYDGELPPPDSLLPQLDDTPSDETLLAGGGGGGADTEPSSTAVTPSASKTIESVFVEAQRQLSADLGSSASSHMLPPPAVTGESATKTTTTTTMTTFTTTLDGLQKTPPVGSDGRASGVEEKGHRKQKMAPTLARTNADVSASTDSGYSGEGVSRTAADDATPATSVGEDARLGPAQPVDSCADSVTSEADSALSGSSSNADALPSNADAACASRSDSPLNDNFDNADFNAFLLSLKRVKTPVEFCDTIEDSMNEIDALINDLKNTSPRLALKSPITTSSSTNRTANQAGKTDDPCNNNNNAGIEGRPSLLSAASSSTPPAADGPLPMTASTPNSFSSPAPLRSRASTDKSSASCEGLSDVSADEGEGRRVTSATRPSSASFTALRPSLSGPQTPNLTPAAYPRGTPNIGPFLSALLSKLETMMANTLYVNLLLTGVLARLSCYPQPLLRSFLLNHSLVFQPTVKSLVQVLGSVKHKVDCYSYTVKDFESLLLRARRFLAWREEQFYSSLNDERSGGSGRPRSVTDVGAIPSNHGRTRGGSVIELPKAEKKKTLGDLLFRRSPLGNKKGARDPRLQMLGDGKGMRYINRTLAEAATNDKMESVKTKNAVYCAIVLEEFLKELAAISQEHAVLSLEGGASLLQTNS